MLNCKQGARYFTIIVVECIVSLSLLWFGSQDAVKHNFVCYIPILPDR